MRIEGERGPELTVPPRGTVVTARRGGKTLRVVEWFNAVCPVGTPVTYWPGTRAGEGREGVTRSRAWILPSGEPVVMIEGYAGGVALSHVVGRGPLEDRRVTAAEVLARRPDLAGVGIALDAVGWWTA